MPNIRPLTTKRLIKIREELQNKALKPVKIEGREYYIITCQQ